MKLIKWAVELLAVPPVVIDGALYVFIAVFGAIQAILTSDECYKYMNPYAIFYAKAFAGVGLAAAGALKMFRSNTYSEHLAAKEKDRQASELSRTSAQTEPPKP